MKTAAQRFWEKVEMGADCWRWTAQISACGYGRFWFGGRMVPAHHFSFQEREGPIPAGMTIDHLCKVRSCVNPAHMEVVTQAVNVLRGDAPPAKNARKTRCPRGHEYSVVKSGSRKGQRYCLVCQKERRSDVRGTF